MLILREFSASDSRARSMVKSQTAFHIGTTVLSCLIVFLRIDALADGYGLIVILPFLYLANYIAVFKKFAGDYPFTVYGIIVFQWIRFVLMPVAISFAGADPGMDYLNPSPGLIQTAVIAMIYEMIAVSIFSYLWFGYLRTRPVRYRSKKLSGNRLVYYAFILFAVAIYLSVGRQNNLLNFIYIPVVEGMERLGDITDTSLVLARQILLTAIAVMFLMTLAYSKERYGKTSRPVYFYYPIVVAFLSVLIIVGERRTAQIYVALVSIWFIVMAFPGKKRLIIYLIGVPALVVLGMMSVYKFFAAFMFDSYVESLRSSTIDVNLISRLLQIYFFGPENIAVALEFSKNVDGNFFDLLFDLSRSLFGVSFFLKDAGVLTSGSFNSYIYGEGASAGHVLSAASYGFHFFGFIFVPLFAAINIVISTFAERLSKRSLSLEFSYIWMYVLVRFCTNLFALTPPLMSYSSMIVGTSGLLFLVAMLLKKKRRGFRSSVPAQS